MTDQQIKEYFNPDCSGENCGYTSIAYGLFYQSDLDPGRHAGALYKETRSELLGTSKEPLSEMLLFPQTDFDDVAPKGEGYSSLVAQPHATSVEDRKQHTLARYTIRSVAEARGLKTSVANRTILRQHNQAFGGGFNRTVEDVVSEHLEKMDDSSMERIENLAAKADMDTDSYQKHVISKLRDELPGLYIIGSKSEVHFMNMWILKDGRIIGVDPQSGEINSERFQRMLDESRRREDGFDYVAKVQGVESFSIEDSDGSGQDFGPAALRLNFKNEEYWP